MNRGRRNAGPRPVSQSLKEYGRGLAGGLLFSLPLLYTMEVWWTGFLAVPWVMILGLLMTFALLLGYNRYAGMRRDSQFREVIIDSVEELGIGLLVSAGILSLIGQITAEMPLSVIIGKVVIEAMTVAIGVSVGTAQLGGGGHEDNPGQNGETAEQAENTNPSDSEDTGSEGDEDEQSPRARFLGDLVLAFCGAVLFASNVAPTEEILKIAVEASTWKLVLLAMFSILIAGWILFYMEFLQAERISPEGDKIAILRQLTSTYAIALLTSALMLWFFQRLNDVSLGVALAQIIVLGFPTVLGASAGRLLIQ